MNTWRGRSGRGFKNSVVLKRKQEIQVIFFFML
jgi:hypothetical protein